MSAVLRLGLGSEIADRSIRVASTARSLSRLLLTLATGMTMSAVSKTLQGWVSAGWGSKNPRGNARPAGGSAEGGRAKVYPADVWRCSNPAGSRKRVRVIYPRSPDAPVRRRQDCNHVRSYLGRAVLCRVRASVGEGETLPCLSLSDRPIWYPYGHVAEFVRKKLSGGT